MKSGDVGPYRPQLTTQLGDTGEQLHPRPPFDGMADDIGHGHADDPCARVGTGIARWAQSTVVPAPPALGCVGHLHRADRSQRQQRRSPSRRVQSDEITADGRDPSDVLVVARRRDDHGHALLGQAEEQAGEGGLVLCLLAEPPLALSGVDGIADPDLGGPALDIVEVRAHRTPTYRQHWLRWRW